MSDISQGLSTLNKRRLRLLNKTKRTAEENRELAALEEEVGRRMLAKYPLPPVPSRAELKKLTNPHDNK